MKIAYVVPYVPSLIRTRSYNLICQLAALGHEVTVFTLGSGEQDYRDAKMLRSRVTDLYYQEHSIWHSLWNSIKAVPSRRPLQTVYSWNPELAMQLVRSVSDNQNRFDIVHVEHLRGAQYGQYIKTKLPHVPVIWDSVDCISYLFKQASAYNSGGFGKFVTRFELGRTRLMEGKLTNEFDRVLVTSETDKNALLELILSNSEPAPVSVLANGVDLEYFHPNRSVQKDLETLVFSGKMSYHANISMVKYLVSEIMPKVWRKRQGVRLVIVGKDPPVEIFSLGDNPKITVTGTVDDIRPYLWKAACAVVPLVYGAGIQNKILEAMACGTPVITTSKPLSSLQVVPGKELLVADGADEFANNILRLLDDQKLQFQISSFGENYVRSHHNWISIAQKLLEYYANTIQTFPNENKLGMSF